MRDAETSERVREQRSKDPKVLAIPNTCPICLFTKPASFTNFNEMNFLATSSELGGRIINLEIRGLEECQYLKTLVSGEKVGDLVEKLRKMMPEVKKSENIKIHLGKYLILQEEDISILNTDEEVIVTIVKKQNPQIDSKEYIEQIEEKKIKVEDGSLIMNEDDMKKKTEDLREEHILHEENIVKKMKTAIIKREIDLKSKGQIFKKEKLNVKYIEAKSILKEDELVYGQASG